MALEDKAKNTMETTRGKVKDAVHSVDHKSQK